MPRFLIYDTSTGFIDHSIECQEDAIETHIDIFLNSPLRTAPAFPAAAMLSDSNPGESRVDITSDPHAVIQKTAISYSLDHSTITADGTDAATISGLPDGARAWLNGDEYEPTAGALTIVADLAGVYQIELTHPLYLKTVVEITAE